MAQVEERLHLRVTLQTKKKLEELAEMEECSMSVVMSRLIREEWQKKQKELSKKNGK